MALVVTALTQAARVVLPVRVRTFVGELRLAAASAILVPILVVAVLAQVADNCRLLAIAANTPPAQLVLFVELLRRVSYHHLYRVPDNLLAPVVVPQITRFAKALHKA